MITHCRRAFIILLGLVAISFTGSAESANINNQNKKKSSRIVLKGINGTQSCDVIVPQLNDQNFVFSLPEAIGCAQKKILFHVPRFKNVWSEPDESGATETTWKFTRGLFYSLKLIPAEDYVDAVLTLKNLDTVDWKDVWSFNCLAPDKAPDFKAKDLTRIYISVKGKPTLLSEIPRAKSSGRSLGFYYHENAKKTVFPFIARLRGINTTRPDDSWIVSLSKDKKSYMAATSPEALFLFNNLQFSCIHSAAYFGEIDKGKSKTMTCRFFFGKGDLDDFLAKFKKYKSTRPQP